MGERPGLSKGEMEVARVLWELGRGTVRQVHEGFPADREIDFTTVQTYLRRLESKGYVRARLIGRTRVYRPRVKSSTVIRETLNELIDRLFGGEALPLVRHVIEDRQMTAADIESLRELLDALEAQISDRSSSDKPTK